MSKLTAKQAQFIAEYLIDLNATQAAVRAGYSIKTAQRIGSENLLKPVISTALTEAIKARGLRTTVTADRVIQEIARIAFFDPRKLLNPDGSPKPINELDDDTAAALAGLDITEEFEGSGADRVFTGYTKKFKLADKNSALEKLAKHLGMYEVDNKQKTDALADILAGLGRSVMPVARDS